MRRYMQDDNFPILSYDSYCWSEVAREDEEFFTRTFMYSCSSEISGKI